MHLPTFDLRKISLFLALNLILSISPAAAQQFQPLFKAPIDVNNIQALKERSRTTKMSTDLLMMLDAYQSMKAGQTVEDIMPMAKEFLVMKNDQVGLEIIATDIGVCQTELRSMGATDIVHFKQVINCMMPMAKLEDMTGMAPAKAIKLVYKPITNIGATTSQGDIAQLSDVTRIVYGVDGTGNKIGVLSDSYDNLGGAAGDIMSGDLPGAGNPNGFTIPVDVLSDFGAGGSDEGRAMLQIVHDVAPGSDLGFHTAFNGQADFAQGILDLNAAGCNIIVDDVFYFAEPYYMPGIVAQAVQQVCTAGSMYFSSAGNSDRSSYEGIYSPGSDLCPGYISAHEFAPGDPFLSVTFAPGNYVIVLQWDEPFFSVTGGANPASDLDLCAWDENLNFITCAFDFNNNGVGDAFEILFGTGISGTFNFSIEHFSGPVPNRVKMIIYGPNATFEFGNTAPTLTGHANTQEACAVGASAWFMTPTYGFGPPAGLNSFSSWGGVPIVFDATGAPLPSPLVYNKPDFVAPDGGNTTFFFADIPQDPDVYPNFFGTSASAPHAAAAAALIFEANPGHTKDDVKSTLISTAEDMLSPGFDYGSGAGLINVGAALSAALPLNAAPNCQNINASIAPDGIARINLSDFIINAASGVGQLDVTVHRGPVLITQRLGIYATDYLILPNACFLQGHDLKVTITNALGTCWSLLTLKNNQIPILNGRITTVFCDDTLVHNGGIGGAPPIVQMPCTSEPIPTAQHAADWVTPYDCMPGVQDTVKVIIREWEAFDKRGNRGVAFDTIIVLQFPEIDQGHIYCAQRDTVYCADTTRKVGPFITFDNFGTCDTIYLVDVSDQDNDGILEFTARDFEDKCGLAVHLDAWQFGGSCETQYKIVVELKQSCYGSPDATCTVNPPAGTSPNLAELLGPGYWRCEFWLIDQDTISPKIIAKEACFVTNTGTHECAAHTYISPVQVKDDWSGVKQVKATIEGIGSFAMSYNGDSECYESHTLVKLPYRDSPYYVVYEAYDSCHSALKDTFFIYVRDNVRPNAVADKGVTVSLSDKKVWVDAASFDEGSWDNCGIQMLLARRTDWYESCIDLCDSIDTCWVGEHHDTLWQAFLETDKHLDPVESHYARTLDWLCNDGGACGEIIYNAWIYDLIKYGTLHCVEHPYNVDAKYVRKLIDEAWDKGLYKKFKNSSYLLGGSQASSFSKIDLDTDSAVIINSSIPFSTEIEYDFKNQKLYATTGGGLSLILEIDEETGDVLSVVPHEFGALTGLEFIGSKLYGTFIPNSGSESYLVVVDPTSGVLVKIGHTGYGPISGLAYDDCHQILYGVTTGIRYDPDDGLVDEPTQLVQLDLNSGAASPIGPVGYDVVGSIEFGPDGRLYGGLSFNDTYPGYLLEIDPATGEGLLLGDVGHTITGLTSDNQTNCVQNQLDIYEQIGGGWSDAVPFSCEDACGPVTVEILVMDYWCNWSKAWTNVWVEDKTPVEVVKDVVEQEVITCKVYKENNYSYPGEEHPVSIEYIIEQAKTGEQDAYDALDGIFGGYCKAWRDPYGNYVDSAGVEIECDIPFYDSICDCKDTTIKIRVYDEHLGYLWIDSLVKECFYDSDTLNFQKGVVVVNCAENVYCEQEVWCDFDHCGQGYIFRKFKIWQGCPEGSYAGMPDSLKHPVDTIYRHQRIWVGNECELDKYMFDVPYDTEVISCAIEYGPDGNVIGDAGPENTGYATYKFDDDCRIVGIAHEDKVFKIVGGEAACYKILRTWYFADWCGYGADAAVPTGKWWLDADIVLDKCVQKIIVIDTVPPVCVITGPVASGDSVALGACDYDLAVTVDATDACGLTSYYWELKDITDSVNHIIVDSGSGNLGGDVEDNVDISSEGLYPGTYKLKVQIMDECTNESYCEYVITVTSEKKPTPVCITSLTARLTPWDSDGDGEVDTAHAVVWAYEYDRSSLPACEDDSLEYRIEIRDGSEDDESAAGDLDFLEVGCAEIGTHLVRIWFISHPSGSRDYCDAVLIVQSDGSGCAINQGTGEQVMVNEEMTPSMTDKVPDRGMEKGDQGVSVSGDAFGVGNFLEEGYELEQNQPNPFQVATQIGFILPESMDATIEVFDVTGRMLKSIRGSFIKGYNRVELQSSDLQQSGVLYYQLRAGSYVATKRMIVIY